MIMSMSYLYATMYAQLTKAVEQTLTFPEDDFPPLEDVLKPMTLEPPKDAAHGDMATNVAMILAKPLRLAPRAIAEQLVPALQALPEVAEVSIAGAGFINLRLQPAAWHQELQTILQQGAAYGTVRTGEGIHINVEYVSANPTGPLHIGHARGAVVGDALARLLARAGYTVTKEYYINDAGAQVDVLAESAFLRYREACGEVIAAIPEGLYPGEYLCAVGQALHAEHGTALLVMEESSRRAIVKQAAIRMMMDSIRADLAELGIAHDVFFSEASLHAAGAIEQVVQKLTHAGYMYRGVLEPPKGKLPDDWEEREQLLFASSNMGDDVDRAVQKHDGSWTYFAGDLAYLDHKIQRGFQELVMVLGADHGGYVKRMQAATYAISGGCVALSIQLAQLVKFLDNGQPVKMSKRKGTFTTAREVVDAVGRDVVRFIMLTRKPEQSLDFDLVKATEKSRENPVFYVQYAYARVQSLLNMATEQAPAIVQPSRTPPLEALALLTHPAEQALIQLLCQMPRLVQAAATAREPHRIAYYLHDVATMFHSYWHTGKEDLSMRFIRAEDPAQSLARIALARAVADVIESGLDILGVKPVDAM